MVPSGDAKRAEELKPLFWGSNFSFLSGYTMHGHSMLLGSPVAHPMCTTHCPVGAGEPDTAAVPIERWHTPGDPDIVACGDVSLERPVPGAVGWDTAPQTKDRKLAGLTSTDCELLPGASRVPGKVTTKPQRLLLLKVKLWVTCSGCV